MSDDYDEKDAFVMFIIALIPAIGLFLFLSSFGA
jgi:hypothetical protein